MYALVCVLPVAVLAGRYPTSTGCFMCYDCSW